MEKVLVVGALGLIGKELMSSLGEKAIGIDVNVAEKKILKADISNYSALEKVFQENRISSCVNLAAIALPLECEKNKKDAFLVNVAGNLNLLELCAQYDVEFYYASSVRVYDTSRIANEDSPVNPSGVYMKTKVLSEKIIQAYFERKLLKKAIIFRFSNVYGKDNHKDRLIPSLISQTKGGAVEITNSNTKFDLIYVKDVVKAILLSMEKSKGFQIYNVVSGKLLSVEQIAKILIKKINPSATLRIKSKQSVNYPVVSNEKIKNLGLIPVSFEQSLDEIVAYY